MSAQTWVILWLLAVMVGVPLAMASAAALSSLGATDATELLVKLRKLLLSGNRDAAERIVSRADDSLLRFARAALAARLPVGAASAPNPEPSAVKAMLDDAAAEERRAIDTWWYLGLLGAIPPALLLGPMLATATVHRPIVVGVTLVCALCAVYATRKRFEALAGLEALSSALAGFVRSDRETDPED